jgi:D-tyrosyl-tRNA(Tyr) deacylase
MRIVIQRVKSASVEVESEVVGQIKQGLLLLIGVEDADNDEDISWLNLRIFPDNEKPMNRSVQDINGQLLVVSQFTLYASTKKGNRPSFIKAAAPEKAERLYEKLIDRLKTESALTVASGRFGKMMEVSLINDGPVSIIIDSKNRE